MVILYVNGLRSIIFTVVIGLTPLAAIFWMVFFTELLYKDKQKLIVGIFVIEAIIYQIITIIILFTNPSLIVARVSEIDALYLGFVLIFLMQLMVIFAITGPFIARESLRSENPELIWKGRFLILGFMCYITGSILDANLELQIGTLFLYRILLIISSIFFYLGFFLPEKLKKLLLKESK